MKKISKRKLDKMNTDKNIIGYQILVAAIKIATQTSAN
jgi:hypothetical protein